MSSGMTVLQANQDREIKATRGLATSGQHPSIRSLLPDDRAQRQRARRRSAECSKHYAELCLISEGLVKSDHTTSQRSSACLREAQTASEASGSLFETFHKVAGRPWSG